MIKLYQKSSTGKTKFLELSTVGSSFITTWGLLDGKTQTTTKICEGKNLGKANETTPEQQAILEMEAKATKKREEGYSEAKPDDAVLVESQEINLDSLPKSFCPSKPIGQNKLTDEFMNNPHVFGMRKHDGHCLILVRGTGDVKVYTRRMEDITQYLKDLPVVKEAASKIPIGSFVLHEYVFYNDSTKRESPRHAATVIRKKDAAECLSRYTELLKEGTFSMIPFDALFVDNKFIGETVYLDRVALLKNYDIHVPQILKPWKDNLNHAKAKNWEGLVLRLNDSSSYVGYTLDGKAKRMGAYKYKFCQTSDFFVTEVLKGDSGKHTSFYSKFKVAQYDEYGNVVQRGYVGGGKLSHDELKTLTEELDSKKRIIPFCLEIEYQSIQDSGALQFGQIIRVRDDKIPSECVADD